MEWFDKLFAGIDRQKKASGLSSNNVGRNLDTANRAAGAAITNFIDRSGLGGLSRNVPDISSVVRPQVPPKITPVTAPSRGLSTNMGRGRDNALATRNQAPPMPAPPATNPSDGLLEQLLSRLQEPYSYSGEGESEINDIYNKTLAQIGQVRQNTEKNFGESTKRLGGMYGGMVNTINTRDADQLSDINNDLVQNNSEAYSGATNRLQEDRTRRIAERTEMLQRLGITDAGTQAVGEVQDSAIANLEQDRAAGEARAGEYRRADMNQNVGYGQAMGQRGIESQRDLETQLQQILGQLSERQIGVEGDRSQALLANRQQDFTNWRGAQDSIQGSLDSLYEQQNTQQDRALELAKMQAESQGKARTDSGGAYQAMANRMRDLNQDPIQVMKAFNEANLAVGNLPPGADRDVERIRKMQELGIDRDAASQWVYGFTNFGQDSLR